MKPCGTKRAYLDHLSRGEDCQVCREASNRRRREQRRRAGVPPRRRPRCGTLSGRNAHYDAGESPCEACRDTWNDYQRAYRAGTSIAKRGRVAGLADLIVDVCETWGRPLSTSELVGHVERIRPAVKAESVRVTISRLARTGGLVGCRGWDGVHRWSLP